MTAVALLALFVMRPGVGRLRDRVVRSISLALGRPVSVSAISVRLLPRPGFELYGFVVDEDPAFGSEPIVRAEGVSASLRVIPLLRGRLEISSLMLTEPSLNLVENASGHWNLEKLLERAASTPVAPTGKRKSEPRPGFPYIEADRGRINFKFGQEKKAYALTDADFAIWQDSENAWGMRLKAQPVRTDFYLSDTGILRVSGSWQRAPSLRETPLQFSAAWERGQLGQITKLVYGRDLGWRGTVSISGTLQGSPGALAITSQSSVDDFRRYDLAGGGLRVAAQCVARYSSADHSLSGVSCQAPVGPGFFSLDGNLAGYGGTRTYDFNVLARDVPMQSLVLFAQHAKNDIPSDLVAGGMLDAAFELKRAARAGGSTVLWTGGGETRGFTLQSSALKSELMLDKVPFAVTSGTAAKPHGGPPASGDSAAVVGPRLEVGPFNLALGRPAATSVHGWLGRSDYQFLLQGEAPIRRLLQLAHSMGLSSFQPAADGIAKVDLRITGGWSAFFAPTIAGTAQLRGVRAEVRGLNEPLEIASASVTLAPNQITVKNVVASIAGSNWRGSLQMPRPCGEGACTIHFEMHADSIATDELSQLLTPDKRPWYRFLSAPVHPGSPFLRTLHAAGNLTADRVAIHKLVASRVSANAELEGGRLRLSDLQGDLLGGKHVGEWKVNFSASPPEYAGSGELQGIALAQLSAAMHDDWVTGQATVSYHASANGISAADLLSSATANLQVEALSGVLPHITLAGPGAPLQMRHFTGRLLLQDGNFEIQESQLETPQGVYQVSGTASLGRVLKVKLMRSGAPSFSITGPLTEPRVAEISLTETRAALKP